MVCDLSDREAMEVVRIVLILILLEYGLRLSWCELTDENGVVLILILLEYGLRLLKSQIIDFQTLKI